jgi:hypothetical protein
MKENRVKYYRKGNWEEHDLNYWTEAQQREEKPQLLADVIRPDPNDHPWNKAITQALISPTHRHIER